MKFRFRSTGGGVSKARIRKARITPSSKSFLSEPCLRLGFTIFIGKVGEIALASDFSR